MPETLSTEMSMLQVDLGLINAPNPVNTYLQQCLDAAEAQINDKGVFLDKSCIDDVFLLVSYAAWLYRRRDSNFGMPRSLEYQLRNRHVAAHTGGGG